MKNNNMYEMVKAVKTNVVKLMDSKNVDHPCQIIGWLDDYEFEMMWGLLLHDKMESLSRKAILWYILCHWDMPGTGDMIKNINYIKKAYLKDKQRRLHQLCVASWYDYDC